MRIPLGVWWQYWVDRLQGRECWRAAGCPPSSWQTRSTAMYWVKPGWRYDGCDVEYRHQPRPRARKSKELITW